MSISLLFLENLDQSLYQVTFLKKIAPSETFISQSIYECHSVLQNTPIWLKKEFIDDFSWSLVILVITIQQIVMLVSINNLF